MASNIIIRKLNFECAVNWIEKNYKWILGISEQ